ncbi:unnamed protein product [Linum tenue]|uniref:DUF295 domain-containing protein n=1 Tax=Linum tenue TaxID=586396 RepID=A0AAV0PQP9_9ROSI|nr:unnamed protein product [Linum tenue]CAI0473542.1 unnamed protein product [Linum tenue]
MGEDQRPWTNVCPELLDSIYKRLPSHVDGTHFGNVCKNWHRVHSRIALSNPLPVFIKRAKLTSSDVIQVQEGGRLLLQRRRESLIPHWLSALPTAPGSMILMVYADLYFSVLRRGKNGFEQKTYDFSLRGKKGQICLGVGYKDGRFFCLFEMGDMLIFSADKNEMRMLLAAIKPLLPEELCRWNDLGVLAMVEKKVMTVDDRYHEEREMLVFITFWERDYEASEKDNFRLVGVDGQVMTTMRDLLFENDYEKACLEDWSNKGFTLVKEPLPLKMNLERCSLNMVLFIVSEVVLIFGLILIFGFKN